MTELKEDNLQTLLENNPKLMVQYGASWCGNCRITKPKFRELSEKNKDITFVYVDAEKFPESRKLAKVDNLPTFAAFSAGKLVTLATGNKLETIKNVLHEIANN